VIYLVEVDCWYKPAPGAGSKAGTREQRELIVEADDWRHAREIALKVAEESSCCAALLDSVQWRSSRPLQLPAELLGKVGELTAFRAMNPQSSQGTD
jgi:hypothetical protein